MGLIGGNDNWQVSEEGTGQPGTGYAETESLGDFVRDNKEEALVKSGLWVPGSVNEMLYNDVEAMNAGKLGDPESVKQGKISAAQTAGGAQLGGMQEEYTRDNMAAGGGFGGQYAETIHQLGGEAGEIGARAAKGADEDSRNIAEARRAEILGRMDVAHGYTRENLGVAKETATEAMGAGMEAVTAAQGGITEAV